MGSIKGWAAKLIWYIGALVALMIASNWYVQIGGFADTIVGGSLGWVHNDFTPWVLGLFY